MKRVLKKLRSTKELSPHKCLKYFIGLLVWTIIVIFLLTAYIDDKRNFICNNDRGSKAKMTDALTNCSCLKNPNRLKLDKDELVHFDYSAPPNQKELIAAIETEHPSIAFRYWLTHKGKSLQKSKNCAKFPTVLKLRYHNKYWQTFVKQNITIQLYNAYYDARPTLKGGPIVRLLAMSNTDKFANQTIYCQLWYDDSLQPNLTTAIDFHSIWNLSSTKPEGHLFPFLIDCPLPLSKQGSHVPKVVSLVANECDTATNILRVHYEIPQYSRSNYTKQKFAICVQSMDYPHTDISAHLVEWIELQFILGVSKIFFYQLEMHPNVTKVLAYYKQRGLVDIRPITLADGEPNLESLEYYLLQKQPTKKLLNELIPYNDCFYRNIYRYEYISVQNIDEVLMSLGNLTKWSELMEIGVKIQPKGCPNGYASYCLRSLYFSQNNSAPHDSDISSFIHMLQHSERNMTDMRTVGKTTCFHHTNQVIMLRNNFSHLWLNVCSWKEFDADVVQLQRFRALPILNNSVIDRRIWRYRDELLQRSLNALRNMGFLHQEVPAKD